MRAGSPNRTIRTASRSRQSPKPQRRQRQSLAIYGAAASLTATTADYGRFLLEILDPKPADAFRLSERGLREYLRPQMKRDEIKSGSLGWVVAQTNGLTILSHAGSAPGWYCDAIQIAGRKAGIVIMSNGDNFLPFYAEAEVGSGVLSRTSRASLDNME